MHFHVGKTKWMPENTYTPVIFVMIPKAKLLRGVGLYITSIFTRLNYVGTRKTKACELIIL